MMRLVIAAGFVLTSLLAFGVYQGVTTSRALEAHVKTLNRSIADEQAKIKVLRADWALLTKPERLQDLASRHLSLERVAAAQFTQFASLPMRGSKPARRLSVTDLPKRVPPAAASGVAP